jgi:hypothetical protein
MEETTSFENSVRDPAEFEKQNKNSSCSKFILKYAEYLFAGFTCLDNKDIF